MALALLPQDIEVFAYETWPLAWEVKMENGQPKILDFSVMKWVMKTSPFALTEILSKVPTIDPEQNNLALVTVLPSDNQNLAAGTYYYELQVRDATGKQRKVAYGHVKVNPTAIRS